MSKKSEKKNSLSDKLSELIQTKPSALESDDDDIVTVAKIAPNDYDSEYSADELEISHFRRLNSGLLDDKKYLGKTVYRKDLSNSQESEFSKSEENSNDEIEDLASQKSFIEINADGERSGSEDLESSENETECQMTSRKREGESFDPRIFSKAANDLEKGKAIKNQLHIWDFLLETRMKFQKCLTASNQFPNHMMFPKFKCSGGSQFYESLVQCKKSLKYLLNSLLSLQYALLNLNEDFMNFNNYNKRDIIDDKHVNESISESEKEHKITEEKSRPLNNFSTAKIKSLNNFSSEISKRHDNFTSYRNDTIQKWNDKTRIGYISNKNFSAFEQSTLKQIEHVLLDKQRLIKRTQTKRLNYHVLGEEDNEPSLKKPAKLKDPFTSSLDSKTKILYKEIFDDNDFYHQLLNELIKKKANDVTDPLQLGRQWMQLQKMRSSMKKVVDTKASKGRKVRFVVHPKLVNFMMPRNDLTYNEESKSELFSSLFGKTKK